MQITRRNLQIAKLCATKPIRTGDDVSKLYFTKTGTMAIGEGGVFAVSVSAVNTSASDGGTTIEPSLALALIPPNEVQFELSGFAPGDPPPFHNEISFNDAEVTHSFVMEAALLLQLMQAALDFDPDGIVRVRFTDKAIILDERYKGQKWEALMGPTRLNDTERFAPPCPRCNCEMKGGICQNHGCAGR